MERDRRTRSGARAPGVERQRPLERRCSSAQRPPAQNGELTREAGSTKDNGKPCNAWSASPGQALSETPALKPYWGKPAVRNFREGNGNVGIIRSPLRAIALPDQSGGCSNGMRARVNPWVFNNPLEKIWRQLHEISRKNVSNLAFENYVIFERSY